MSKDSSITPLNQTNYSVSVKHKPEKPYLITEGRLEHLDAIASRIQKYEDWAPKWNTLKTLMGVCSTAFLFGFGLLIPDYYSDNSVLCNSLTGSILLVISIGSGIGAITLFLCNQQYNKERKDQIETDAQKMMAILEKVRESIDDS